MQIARRHPTSPRKSNTPTALAEYKKFMAEARHEAEVSYTEGGVPVGSVLVRKGQIIGRGHNQRMQRGSAILHGEMDCLMNAGRQVSYLDTTLYTTLSPCMMCTGTILQFNIPRVIVGENRNFGGNEDFLRQRGVNVVILDDPDCYLLMKKFIDEHKSLWAEDIGHVNSRGDARVAIGRS